MSLREQAIQRIVDLDADQVCQLVVRRITGDDTVPLGSRFSDEAGEDLVIWLLREQDLPKEIRLAVISGCELVYSRILAWLAAPKHANGGNDLEDVATRLCRVVDVAGPGELRNHADAMLNLACTARDLPSRVLPAAVRACMSFGSTPDHVPLWEQLLQRREVAAYAFNALLAINPRANRITNALAMLWRKQLCDKWNIDTAFLARRAARLRGSQKVIHDALRVVVQDLSTLPDYEQLRQAILADLDRRSWSQHWIQHLHPEREAPRREAPKGFAFEFLRAEDTDLLIEESASLLDYRVPISVSLNRDVADSPRLPGGWDVLYLEKESTLVLGSGEVESSFGGSMRILDIEFAESSKLVELAESVKLGEVFYPASTVRKTKTFSLTQK